MFITSIFEYDKFYYHVFTTQFKLFIILSPEKLQIHPVNGPIEGGTILTVKGENLGISANDTVVSVAGVDCVVLQYEPSVQ